MLVAIDKIPKAENVNIKKDKIHRIFHSLISVCETYNGIGLSAVQIGIPKKIFVVRYITDTGNEYIGYVNCTYEPNYDLMNIVFKSKESCLSIPNKTYSVLRYRDITVKGHIVKQDTNKIIPFIKQYDLNNPYCAIMQHEIDHQKNILISEIGTLLHKSQI